MSQYIVATSDFIISHRHENGNGNTLGPSISNTEDKKACKLRRKHVWGKKFPNSDTEPAIKLKALCFRAYLPEFCTFPPYSDFTAKI